MTDMPTIERVREPKVYCGNRGRFNTLVEVRQPGVARPLELRLDLFNHSPTGFDGAPAARVPRNWRWRSSPITSASRWCPLWDAGELGEPQS